MTETLPETETETMLEPMTEAEATTLPAGARPASSRARRFRTAALLGGLALLIVLVAGPPRSDGAPLDPDGTGPLGTKALVLLLRRVGADVRVSSDVSRGGAGTTSLVLVDELSAEQRDALSSSVQDGAVVVVADPQSPMVAAVVRRVSARVAPPPRTKAAGCQVAALSGIGPVEPGGGVGLAAPDAIGCFAYDGGSYAVVRPLGSGAVVVLGGPGALVNERLDHAGNAALAIALLAPTPGTSVTVLRPPPPGRGRRSLWQLVSRGVKAGLVQLLVAFLVLVAWRARRLGRPVLEPQPVQVESSALVTAMAGLLGQGSRRNEAAGMLRRRARRMLADRLGTPPSAPSADLAAAVAARTARPPAETDRLLADGPVTDDAALVELTRQLASICEEITHAP